MRRCCVFAGLLFARASGLVDSAGVEDLPDDEVYVKECGSDGGLSLKQLRARAMAAQEPEPLSPGEASAPTVEGGLPGGWGEAADYLDALGPLRAGMEPEAHSEAAIRWHSCAQAGCTRHYIPWRPCQCNEGCASHGSCCADYADICGGGGHGHHGHHGHTPTPAPPAQPDPSLVGANVMTLYHQTGESAGMTILREGFHPGAVGWCGGGIYFATSPEATETKAIGPDSHKGFMIEARVDIGRVLHGDRRCTADGHHLNSARAAAQGYDSISFNPGDGDEYIVFSSSRVLSVRQIPWP